ncbi:iron-sulfur cluster carrier protein ApbC [Pseudidiomarina sediminum]|uniref:Iron-sulfur cluster carrier protein n=1 Tax=Pseudidiomarina sediminum TaxID=431675 RepID=A0A432Z7P3_9GAMM|nr:iron-sulfur cluster carrier protein ApbC [Pseudidiomarina sediminum]RUO73853.1 iron-sulfur cluster carrier protein ApbC [Pseudidiomarina sediminum]
MVAQELQQRLNEFRLPSWSQPVPETWWTIDGQDITLTLPFAATAHVFSTLQQEPCWRGYHFHLRCNVQKLPNSQPELPLIYGNVIVVSSGKGGVGKSSVAVQLALALAASGAKVGLLDADIYGPSLPTMLGGADEKLAINAQNKMEPHLRHGVYVSSLGYLADSKDAAIWRGPMASAALQQLLRDTKWPRLDYLVVDMPPGTGDIQLTLAQKVPVTGAVVVTTPQNVALADAQKGIAMFRKVGIPLTGLVENMSYFRCPSCGHEEHVFGCEGGARVAQEYAVPLLAQLPLATPVRESLDAGLPLLAREPEHPLNRPIYEMATAIAGQLYLQAQKQV